MGKSIQTESGLVVVRRCGGRGMGLASNGYEVSFGSNENAPEFYSDGAWTSILKTTEVYTLFF